MWRRGADSDGYVANFVESEQIVQMNGFIASFVQVMFDILICLNGYTISFVYTSTTHE